MTPEQDIVHFSAARSANIGLKAFMVFHALSVASIIFAGWMGVSDAMSDSMLAIAALVSIVLSLALTLIIHLVINARRKTSDDPDILRLTPDGLEGRALDEKGLNALAWSRVMKVEHDAEAVMLHFQPKDLSSSNPADRISAIRIARGPDASAEDMAGAIEAARAHTLSRGA